MRWARLRDASLVAGTTLLVLALPPVVYGALAYRKFGVLRVSWYAPYEELLAAIRSGNPFEIGRAPLVAVNMTSGELIASMFTLSVWQLTVSVALGVLMGLNLVAYLGLRAACPIGRLAGPATTAGSGLLATVAASGTGLLGCCGPGMSGGVLALMGMSAGTAHVLSHASPPVQVALVGLAAVGLVRLRRARRALAAGRPRALNGSPLGSAR
ncbi:MAG TPA: hypothetical protein VF406_14685 [Thermodesulfobacteriota bacterium]